MSASRGAPMDAVKHVSNIFGIPLIYLKQTSNADRVHGVVGKVWLKTLISTRQIPEFLNYEGFEEDEIKAWLQHGEDFGPEWQHVYFEVFRKKEKLVIPLPRVKNIVTDQADETPVTFGEGLQYVSQANHRNLWKEIYKRYSHDPYSAKSSMNGYHISLVPCETVTREIIARMYGCPMINIEGENSDHSPRGKRSLRELEPHCNILPAFLCLETADSFIIIFEFFIPHSLQDCVTYSPAVLGTCHTKPLFIVYQLLQALCSLHDRGLLMGEITLCDILLTDNLWIQMLPKLEDNIHDFPPESLKDEPSKASRSCCSAAHLVTSTDAVPSAHLANSTVASARKLQEACAETQCVQCVQCSELEQACEAWVTGRMSNLEYLTRLNQLAGRRRGDPTCHHVLPWVTDFASSNGQNWRDLTKSKFRLNKGDRQLDLTFDLAHTGLQVPHHVSDVLSDITYYVYLSRRTPKSVLCKVVRSVWVPAEYPSSIQRLQEWTPDECIPEFFTDPRVFKSIHEDLPDLEIPPWATSPEDFIEKHREMLESTYVSERLNHWIDLTFGYKLSGSAAVKSKNVCLHLVDCHTTLSTSGVVQLFSQPHPTRVVPSPYWGKLPPRLIPPMQKTGEIKASAERESEDGATVVADDDDNAGSASPHVHAKSSPLALSRLLSRSRGSLLTPTTEDFPPVGQTPRAGSVTGAQISNGAGAGSGPIPLPRELNPAAMLQACESLHNFLDKTLHRGARNKTAIARALENATCARTPTAEFGHPARKHEGTRFKLQVVAAKRSKEMQILGCLLVELFLASKLRPFKQTSTSATPFELRMHYCSSVLNQWSDQMPRCVRNVVPLLLQGELSSIAAAIDEVEEIHGLVKWRYPVVTSNGLPPPSAHQLVQPFFTSALFPFPPQFPRLYVLIKKSQEYASLSRELGWQARCSHPQDTEINLLAEKLGDCWVRSLAADIIDVIDQLDGPQVQLLLPHVRHLLEERSICVEAAWYLFDPMALALGPRATCTHLLDSIVKLYSDPGVDIDDLGGCGHDSADGSSGPAREPHGNKRAKLYHRSFLLRLIVRLGLRTFLDNFVPPLVEAVGGYHETNQQENDRSDAANRRRKYSSPSSHLQSCELRDSMNGGIEEATAVDVASALSPLDEDSPMEGEVDRRPHACAPAGTQQDARAEDDEAVDAEPEEVFNLEGDEESAPLDRLMFQLELREDDVDDAYQDTCSLGNASGGIKSPMSVTPGTGGSLADVNYGTFDEEDAAPCEESYSSDGFSFASIVRTDEDVSVELQSADVKRHSGLCKVSDMSAESLLWLAHRLGPVLTARCLSRNLLRMLTLCYLRAENLRPMAVSASATATTINAHSNLGALMADPNALEGLRIAEGCVVGDRNAANVLNCLSSIVSLYGEQLIVLQYLPHMGELIALCRRKLSLNLEAGLVGCLALLRHIVPYMTDSTLMDQLHDVILKSILQPAVRLVSTSRLVYPSGEVARRAVAAKFCDALYLLSLRLGREMTHRHLAFPALQRFFLTFSKAHIGRPDVFSTYGTSNPFTDADVPESEILRGIDCPITPQETSSPLRSLEDSSYLEIRRDGTVTEWAVKRGPSVQILRSKSLGRDNDPVESYSPPTALRAEQADIDSDPVRRQAIAELQAVFSPKLAHLVYIPFFRFLGETIMEQSLKNHQLIRDLCFEYEQEMHTAAPPGIPVDTMYLSDYLSTPLDTERGGSGSFGTNVIGNRIELQQDLHSRSGMGGPSEQRDVLSLITGRMEANTTRHLKGNWLAYWEHEIGRSEKDVRFNFKQIKLQTFVGHTNNVRCIVALGNENSFLSGSRDKTVKLWSLRSQGDGSAVSHCQWSYTGHRKSILNVAFIESLRLVASCDSTVQLWDPWLGRVVSGAIGDTSTPGRAVPPIGAIRALPAPSPLLAAATTDATLRLLDARMCSFVNQLKVSLSPAGLIRCLAIGPNGNWIAVGQSSGFLTILDIRTGLVIASWKGHEGEVLQLVPLNDSTLVSSSLDQTVSVWSTIDGKLKFHMKGPTEPVHCMAAYGMELISGTTANRIGVHTAVDTTASFSSTRLRSDTFRGVLTTMAVLPLNRLLLLGSDSGVISLLC